MNINNSDLSQLDELDFAILSHLRENGRKSFTELATALKVSVGTIRNRYTRLTEKNVLQVYGRVNPEKVGSIVYAQILIQVRPSQHTDTVAQAIATYPEVSFLAIMTGEYDIEVNVMCRDNEHLTGLINDRINNLEGVYLIRTNIYLRSLKTAQPELRLLLDKPGNQ